MYITIIIFAMICNTSTKHYMYMYMYKMYSIPVDMIVHPPEPTFSGGEVSIEAAGSLPRQSRGSELSGETNITNAQEQDFVSERGLVPRGLGGVG